MLIIITSEKPITNEAQKINQLFEAGLMGLHLRKPSWTIDEHRKLLNQIDVAYHNRIVIHHFHELINEFNLKGIHFTEQKRKDHMDNPGPYFKGLNIYGKTISASFHNPEALDSCDFEFDYHFLSPVFSSLSKQGYEGRGFEVTDINKLIVALGGITAHNIPQTQKLGYQGVAVLGSIWNAENEVKAYEELIKKLDTIQKQEIKKQHF